MLFNSYTYLIVFLPFTFAIYFLLNNYRLLLAGKAWLVLASFFFYAFWNYAYLPLILLSIIVNYGLGTALTVSSRSAMQAPRPRKGMLTVGILFNLCLLGYFKYADFFINNLNTLFTDGIEPLRIVLPLAISFFTFQQIAYLVDSYKRLTTEYDFLNYCLFVSFFPQLIAGPIVHHGEMMPQFARLRNARIDWSNVARGITLFSLGLFKKVVIADNLAVWAGAGFDDAASLTFVEAWAASLCYTFQLYYDFSGYTDMAIGSALLFNITLPLNFNSPYKAVNIQDFWRRWHMTLSRWLRDYIYVLLGGNRRGEARTYLNLFVTFLLGGLWHGAGWTFVAWGALHGAGTALHKLWTSLGLRLPRYAGWLLTFLFVHCTWVFFRATSFADALKVFRGMVGLNGLVVGGESANFSDIIATALSAVNGSWLTPVFLLVFGLTALLARNSNQLVERFTSRPAYTLLIAVCLAAGFVSLSRVSEFIYFQF